MTKPITQACWITFLHLPLDHVSFGRASELNRQPCQAGFQLCSLRAGQLGLPQVAGLDALDQGCKSLQSRYRSAAAENLRGQSVVMLRGMRASGACGTGWCRQAVRHVSTELEWCKLQRESELPAACSLEPGQASRSGCLGTGWQRSQQTASWCPRGWCHPAAARCQQMPGCNQPQL